MAFPTRKAVEFLIERGRDSIIVTLITCGRLVFVYMVSHVFLAKFVLNTLKYLVRTTTNVAARYACHHVITLIRIAQLKLDYQYYCRSTVSHQHQQLHQRSVQLLLG